MACKLIALALFLSLGSFSSAQTVELRWITLQRYGSGWQVTRLAPEHDWQIPLSAGETVEAMDDHPVAKISSEAMFRLLQLAGTRQLNVSVSSGAQTRSLRLFANSADHLPMFQRFGIGASVSDIDNRGVSTVRQVIPHGPAEQAGLRAGDSITAIDGEPLAGMQMAHFLSKLSSTTPTPVNLKVLRDNNTVAVRVIRDQTIGELMPARTPRLPDELFASMGNQAPSISAHGESAVLNLDALRGTWVFISFWATWCPPCVEEIPKLNSLASNPKISVWGVALEQKRSELQAFLQNHSLRYPVALAGDFNGPVAHSYFVSSLPENVLISPTGEVRWVGDTVPEIDVLNAWTNANGSQLQANPPGEAKPSSHQQIRFSAEESSVERPVPIPPDAMQALGQDGTVKAELENSDEPLKAPPASWFLASYIDLQRNGSQDLIVIAQPPLSGANLTLFWIFRHSGPSYKMVMSAAPAHDLIVKSRSSHGMRNIELMSATAVQWSSTLCKYAGAVYVAGKSQSAPIK